MVKELTNNIVAVSIENWKYLSVSSVTLLMWSHY